MGAQLSLALDNVEAVLAGADMTLANVVRLNLYTTDVDALLAGYGSIARRLAATGVAPPSPEPTLCRAGERSPALTLVFPGGRCGPRSHDLHGVNGKQSIWPTWSARAT
jgi:enamine deaminase RidA (YjgF/YER057c/UK114 family)